jgi:hypothetical protein
VFVFAAYSGPRFFGSQTLPRQRQCVVFPSIESSIRPNQPAMPPRLFPFPLLVGTDICHVPRIRKLCKAISYGNSGGAFDRFLRRILTHPERVYFRHRFGTNQDILSSDISPIANFLAGRYAIIVAVELFTAHNMLDLQQKKHAAKPVITLLRSLAVLSK